jgi:hypothetical protein
MRYTIQQIREAIDFFRYETGCSDTDLIEISLLQENLDRGSIMDTVIFTAEVVKSPETWSRYKGDKKIKYCLEIFPAHENRNPILTTSLTQELIVKE